VGCAKLSLLLVSDDAASTAALRGAARLLVSATAENAERNRRSREWWESRPKIDYQKICKAISCARLRIADEDD
jgi:hypothetical protein